MTTAEIQHNQPFDADEFFGRIERMAGNALPMDLDGADDHIACNCTDRRKPRRCTCGKRRGQGHALSCAMLMGAERGPRVIYADSERAPLALDGRAA